MRIGIDASNLRAGGGRTHLIEVLKAAVPRDAGVRDVIVWGARELLARLPDRDWLITEEVPNSSSFFHRLTWQSRGLGDAARYAKVDLLYLPGGNYLGNFRPFVTMSRNLIPFDPPSIRRYGATLLRLRLNTLTFTQTRTFRRAAGVIFLSDTARRAVQARTGPLRGEVAVIPHGVSARFRVAGRAHVDPARLSAERPFRWLYVSIIDLYKHQDAVAAAVAKLNAEGLHTTVDLVGPAYAPMFARLERVLEQVDSDRKVVKYRGSVAHEDLASLYQSADGAVFASSCENLPNILLENMSAALPIACSERGVMPEVLGECGVFFDPENDASIAAAMKQLILDAGLRRKLSACAAARAGEFTWERCATGTFSFLSRVAARS